MHNLLFYHSYYRWFVLIIMLVHGVLICSNKNKKFTRQHYYILLCFCVCYNIQLVMGWLLYFHSPLVDSFWRNISVGLKNRQIRFFGLEHMSMMTLGIAMLNYYSVNSYKKIGAYDTFSYLKTRYLIAIIIILSSIPWSFSPLTSRPSFR